MGELQENVVCDFFRQLASHFANSTEVPVGGSEVSGVREFFSQLAFKIEISRQMQKDADVYLATRANIVRNYIQPDENRMSDILRDLLDPNGPHGQGSIFLQKFLQSVGAEGMRVHAHSAAIREHYTHAGRRLDLLVTFGDDEAIGIENKLDAEDQDRQVEDYCEYLRGRFSRHILYYLTDSGREPPPHSIAPARRLKAANTLRCISYQKDIPVWLEMCFRECRAEKIRWFLRDLVEFIGDRFVD
jgi:hypothetical protein